MVNYGSIFHLNGFIWTRYPCFDVKLINYWIRKHSPSEKEIQKLKYFSSEKFNFWHIYFISGKSIWYILQTSITCYMLTIVDYREPQRNIETLGNGLSKFMCIYTNCSQLVLNYESANKTTKTTTKENFARDMTNLPVFSLCNPNLRKVVYPFVDLGSNGLILILCISLAMFCFCIVSQFAQSRKSIGDVTVLFIEAPEISMKILRSSMKKCYVDMISSLFSFRLNDISWRAERESSLAVNAQRQFQATNSKDKSKLLSLGHKLELKSEYKNMIEADYNVVGCKHLEQFIDDCIPLIRTDWWRQRMIWSHKLNFYLVLVPSLIITLSVILTIYLFVEFNNDWYERVTSGIKQQACSIWTQNIDGILVEDKHKTFIDLHKFDLSCSPIMLTHVIYAYSVMIFVLNSKNAIAYLSSSELLTMIREINSQIDVIIDYSYFVLDKRILSNTLKGFKSDQFNGMSESSYGTLRSTRLIVANSNYMPNKLGEKFKMVFLRNLLRSAHEDDWVTRPLIHNLIKTDKPYKARGINEKIVIQKLAYEIYNHNENKDQIGTLIELIEKLYIKIKFYLEIRNVYSESMTVLLFYMTISSYISIYTLLLLMRHTSDKRLIQCFVLFSFSYLAVCLIGTASLNYYVSYNNC